MKAFLFLTALNPYPIEWDAHCHWQFILSYKRLRFQPDVFPHHSVILYIKLEVRSRGASR